MGLLHHCHSTMTQPQSLTIDSLSPSRLWPLSRCPKQVALGQVGGRAVGSMWTELGTISHDTLEIITRDRSILGPNPREAFEAAWAVAVGNSRERGHDPEEWQPLKRAEIRTRRKVSTIAQLIRDEGPDSEPLPEQEIYTANQDLGGTADLVIRGSDRTVIIDYKTGTGSHEGEAKSAYAQQLQLYAAIEWENSGRVPARVAVLSTIDGLTEIEITEDSCREALATARSLREQYNSRVPGPQPGTPSHDACMFCSYSPLCEEYWLALDTRSIRSAVDEGTHSLRGTLRAKPTRAQNGNLILEIAPQQATIDHDGVVIVASLNEVTAPDIAGASVGQSISMTGLRLRETGSSQVVLRANTTTRHALI
jgi:RecB family exonuclease